jgi:hypothetical protein
MGATCRLTIRLSDAGGRRRKPKLIYPNHRLSFLAQRRRAPRSLEPLARPNCNDYEIRYSTRTLCRNPLIFRKSTECPKPSAILAEVAGYASVKSPWRAKRPEAARAINQSNIRSSKIRKHPSGIGFIVSIFPTERNYGRFDKTRLNIFPLPLRGHARQLRSERRFEFVNRRRAG